MRVDENVTTGGDSYYAAAKKNYPAAVSGRLRTIKWSVLIITLGIYYFLPFVRWDRGPEAPGQAVLIDCHSMPHEAIEAHTRPGQPRPEVVLGDRYGATAGREVMDRVEAACRAHGSLRAAIESLAGRERHPAPDTDELREEIAERVEVMADAAIGSNSRARHASHRLSCFMMSPSQCWREAEARAGEVGGACSGGTCGPHARALPGALGLATRCASNEAVSPEK